MILERKILFLLTACLLWLTFPALAKDCQIRIVVQNEKQEYTTGDTISVLIRVKLADDFCDEAGDATKVFSQGLKITKRSDWKKISKYEVGQKLLITVLKPQSKAVITAYRKTGHYNCFQQKIINVTGEKKE